MTPKVGTLTKLYYSEKAIPTEADLTHVMYTEEIPELEEAPEAITYQTVDMGEEYSEQGGKRSTQPAVSILYTRSQLKSLKSLADSKKEVYWFVRYPETTCAENEEPLVKRFKGTCALTGQAITVGDMIKDTLTLYRSSAIDEFDGLPTASETGQ